METKRLTSADIPGDVMAALRDQFEGDPQIRQLRTHQNMLQRSGRYMEAMKVAKDIEALLDRVVQTYVDEANAECNQITLDRSGIPEDDIERINECVLTVFMACDIIETAIMDTDDILRKTDADLSLVMFNDLRRLATLAKGKIQYIRQNSAYADSTMWAEKCDNMYDMLRNKARAIIRKRKKDGK